MTSLKREIMLREAVLLLELKESEALMSLKLRRLLKAMLHLL
jgi:hypothetical protein